MGSSKSCLSCHRSSKLKSKYDLQESFNENRNAIDINKVSEDELLLLPGINRQLAVNIVQYRHNNDGFKQVNEILKVEGVTNSLFKQIHADITINLSSSLSLLNNNPISTNNSSVNNLVPLSNQNSATDTLSFASILLETLPEELQTILVSSPPRRPSSIDNPKENIFRFASWNLQQLTNDKVQNPGVREVICRIILENKFSLIGIQEIGNKESLDVIINELNNPTIPSIRDWPNRHQGKWKYTISDVAGQMLQGPEYFGFLYDETIGIELKQSSLFRSRSYFTRSPFITRFRVHNKIEFVFVNIHLKSGTSDPDQTKTETKALAILAQAIKTTFKQKNVIILGSFNIIPTAVEFDGLIKCNYSYMIEENTDITLKDSQGSICLDNIWLSEEAKALSTDNFGVIRDRLHSLWIPAGWSWGGLVSDHCPIWAEFDLS